MALREIKTRIIQRALVMDPNLAPSDIKAYLYLASHPLDTVHGHSRSGILGYTTWYRSTRRLLQHGWAYTSGTGRHKPIVPWMPKAVEETIVNQLMQLRDDTAFVGEWLFRCILDLLVHDDDYTDNARPYWLVAGDGTGRLELDRLYHSQKVAFEFQGSQHFRPGRDFAQSEADVKAQQRRDQIKADLCAREGIVLIHITPEELDVDVIRKKIVPYLPLVPQNSTLQNRPLFRFLERMTRSYRNHAQRAAQISPRDM